MASNSACHIGSTVRIAGRVTGSRELTVGGRIEGSVALDAPLTIEEGGVVSAEVSATDITVRGTLEGDVVASGSVSIASGASVSGELRVGRLAIEDGARFTGTIDMDVDLPDGFPDE